MKFNNTSIIFSTLTVGMILIFGYYFLSYDKLNASWYFPHDVTVTGIIIGPLLGFALLAMFKAFIDDRFVPAQWAGVTAFIFFLLSIAGGIHFTEPKDWTDTYSAKSYAYEDSRAGNWYYINFNNNSSPSSGSTTSPSWTDDLEDGGEGLVYLLIILVFIIILILSCIIPHFWVVACLSFISILMYWSILSLKKNNRHV